MLRRIALALALAGSGTASAQQESHEDAPTLADVEPRRSLEGDERKLWRHRIKASVEFAAMATEVYRGDVTLFNGRDGSVPYFVARYLSGDDPGLELRLMALSPNTTSMTDPAGSAYLGQLGLHDGTVAAGRRIAFLDGSTGGGRTLGRLRQELSGERQHGLVAHAMMGFHEENMPTLRLALRHLAKDAPTLDPGSAMSVADKLWEWGIRYDVQPVERYEQRDGRWVPMAPASSEEEKGAGRAWKQHMRYLLDRPWARELYAKRQALWREVRGRLDHGSTDELLGWLDDEFERRRPRIAEAFTRDVIMIAARNFPKHAQLNEPHMGPLRSAVLAGDSIRGALRSARSLLRK